MKHLLQEDKFFKKTLRKLDSLFDLKLSQWSIGVFVLGILLVSFPIIRTLPEVIEKVQKKVPNQEKVLSSYIPQKIEWSVCDEGLCGSLDVPKDYGDLSKGLLTLQLFQREALTGKDGAPEILVNPGGPGASGIEAVKFGFESVTEEFSDSVNLIGWDPRGVGASTRSKCGDNLDYLFFSTDSSPDTQEEKINIIEQSRKFSNDCWKKSSDLLPYLTSANTVKDMESIRVSLEQEKLNYLGYSYGTYIGQLYASEYPERVGNMVLDGVVDVSLPSNDVSQAKSFDDVLAKFFQWCEINSCDYIRDVEDNFLSKDEALRITLSPKDAFDRLRQTTEQKEWVAEATVGSNEITPYLFELGTASTLYFGENGWKRLDLSLQAMAKNDLSFMLKNAFQYLGRDEKANPIYDGSYESFLTINCADRNSKLTVDELEKTSKSSLEIAPIFGASYPYLGAGCLDWKSTSEVLSLNDEKIKDLKILFIGTTNDPATPYEWSKNTLTHFPASRLITFNGDGHTVFGNGERCVDSAVTELFVENIFPQDNKEC
jgi:pimeloyl-ACP methyl ester carboxylesterase